MTPAAETIAAALDVLAAYPCVDGRRECARVINYTVEVINTYPRRRKCTTTSEVGAYLFVSNARNTAKIGLLALRPLHDCAAAMQADLEAALSLLVD